MKKVLRSPFTYLIPALILAIILIAVLRSGPAPQTLSLGIYQKDLAAGQVASATLDDTADKVTGKLADGVSYTVSYPDRYTNTLVGQIGGHVAPARFSDKHSHGSIWASLAATYLPLLLLFGLFLFVLNSMQGGGSKLMQFGRAKARTANKDQPKVTFADVAGADEAVAELTEIKEFLEAPARFQALGARIPKGVLLFGPPGTGKTLLARAVAGEAGVPFFSISGSDFVEMFVGVGASRVRDLFEQAKSNAPSIVFMDEIDAVGRHRGAGMGGGHDEREQTLNQLLVEMDGFDVRGGVILIAATNRPDILDPALLRPGRFDRQIVVDKPDLAGRRKILDVHAKGKPLHPSVSLETLAKRTPGFTGADLANLLNEGALLTARRNLRQIGMRECEEAIDRVIAGPERKTLVMSEHEKLVTAYHEAGHVLVGHVLPHADPIHKVSIVARSRSLGLTFTLPNDKHNHSRSELRDAMAMCLGGRTAEELVFAEPTTGAENDIEKATRIARAMVTEYGMSDILGPQQLGQPGGEVFLGRDFGGQHTSYSEHVSSSIDHEVRGLIDAAHDRARAILVQHRGVLDTLARELVEQETLDTPELMAIIGELESWPAPAPPALGAGVVAVPGDGERPAVTRRAAVPAAGAQSGAGGSGLTVGTGDGHRKLVRPLVAPPRPGRTARTAPPAQPTARTAPPAQPRARTAPPAQPRARTAPPAPPPARRPPKPAGREGSVPRVQPAPPETKGRVRPAGRPRPKASE
ncbi:MAG TPA: ATP-dependent zinc metalloprotease FtsH [Acidimicrobiales bacterium]|jgi:cell division protease FtsH|nr:ATP-dependent zinc metalloprotease FtsH [Acidimicrobiales bacterium]